MATHFPTLVLIIASFQAAGVLATGYAIPEVIPGPGLPSLASLNLTSADLYAMGKPEPCM
jgi:hypothetical protein